MENGTKTSSGDIFYWLELHSFRFQFWEISKRKWGPQALAWIYHLLSAPAFLIRLMTFEKVQKSDGCIAAIVFFFVGLSTDPINNVPQLR